MIKIAHKTEVETLKLLPLELIEIVVQIAIILDDNYGVERNVDNDLGGYILIAEVAEDVETIKQLIDFQHMLPEYVDLICCSDVENYTSSLFLVSNDYSISTLIPLSLTPKELLKFMEEQL